jgi:acetylornithine deacetylase
VEGWAVYATQVMIDEGYLDKSPELRLTFLKQVLRLLKGACKSLSVDRIHASVEAQRLDGGVQVPRDAEIVRFLQAESGNEPATIPFGTELPYLVQLGAQACVFGPGDIRSAHRSGEFVPVAEVMRAGEILAGAIERFARS